MDELLKLLDIVKRELSADDARVELGGREPTGDRVTWAPLTPGWRVVASFDVAPPDLEKKRERLTLLVSPFGDATSRIEEPSAGGGVADAKSTELDEELDQLAERAGARAAVVFDERSPVLWGCSTARARGWDLDAMERVRPLAKDVRAAGLDPARWIAEGAPSEAELAAAGVDETTAQRWSHRFSRLAELAPEWHAGEWHEAMQIAFGIGAARAECRGGRAPDRVAAHTDDWGVFAKGFAQIYLLALVYDGAYSELHAEGPLVRALPHIETLVLSLPPVEPPPRGAKVIALKRG